MRQYRFTTVWKLTAPKAAVCRVIEDSLAWPEWWPGVERVEELEPGNDSGIGSLRRYIWKGCLPYRLTFDVRVTRVESGTRVEGRATGDVEGFGTWEFEGDGKTTTVRYFWNVKPARLWMCLLSPFASRLFRWNHDALMRQGGLGLARRLNTQLLELQQT